MGTSKHGRPGLIAGPERLLLDIGGAAPHVRPEAGAGRVRWATHGAGEERWRTKLTTSW
jgi:hypothetical protein